MSQEQSFFMQKKIFYKKDVNQSSNKNRESWDCNIVTGTASGLCTVYSLYYSRSTGLCTVCVYRLCTVGVVHAVPRTACAVHAAEWAVYCIPCMLHTLY
jgi:hypothetical protein